MIDKGADVLYAERFGVSDAAKERKRAGHRQRDQHQDKYPDTVVASALWNMEPTIDRAIKAVKEGKFTAEDYGVYSMMKHGAQLAGAAGHLRGKVPAEVVAKVRPRRRPSATASSPSRWTTASPSPRQVGRAARPGHPRRLSLRAPTRRATRSCAARHHQALRQPGGQRRHLAAPGRGEVLALLGENGAGKSTLVSILFGHYVADAGHRSRRSASRCRRASRAALAAGIGMVHQHFTLATT